MDSAFRVSRGWTVGALLMASSMTACAPRLTTGEGYIIPGARVQHDTILTDRSMQRRHVPAATGGLGAVEIVGLALVLAVLIMGVSSR